MGPDPQQKIRRRVLGATKKTDRCFHWATVVSLLQFCGVLEGTNPARGGFVGCVHKGAPPPMAIASYYRDQARLLLSWARETSDRDIAARLRARARELLAQAKLPHEPAVRDLNPLLDEFNDQQMQVRAPRGTQRPAQQQQQVQPKQGDGSE